MLKAKFTVFAIACMMGIFGFSPIVAFAANTNTESVILSEKDRDQKENKAAFDEKMNKAYEKWNTLNEKQKRDIYDMIEKEMKAQNKLLDKLADLGVMEKEDVAMMKTQMTERFNMMKESGEFPIYRENGKKNSK